jgi:hypothetical protein
MHELHILKRVWATIIANWNTQHFGGRIGYELDDTIVYGGFAPLVYNFWGIWKWLEIVKR